MNRKLTSTSESYFVPGTNTSRSNDFVMERDFSIAEIDAALPDVVRRMLISLYRRFDMFEPPADFFANEIAKLVNNRR